MSQPFDLSLFPDLPPEVVKAFEAAQFELAVERAARQHEQAVVAEKDTFITELKALIDKLQGQVGQYRHAKFGPKSEKLDPAQLELALEDLEAAIAETQQQIDAVEAKIADSETDPEKKPRKKRKARLRHFEQTHGIDLIAADQPTSSTKSDAGATPYAPNDSGTIDSGSYVGLYEGDAGNVSISSARPQY